ncbi:MAG: efflux RND transporter periplasmic adaptor subunit [bacterium]
MRASTIVIWLVIAVLLALGVYGGFKVKEFMEKKAEEEAEVVERSIPVHVTEVKEGTVEDIVYVTGYVEPAHRADVHAKIPQPGKLIEAKMEKGDKVRKNQVLATVDRDEVGARYRPYSVKAPRSGIVASITDSTGAMISPQMPVAVIVDIDEVKVKTSIIEQDLGRVKVGTPARVRVEAFPERVFEGKVTKIDPVLDSLSHTASVEITVPNPEHELLPQMYARVELIAGVHSNVPVLKREALFPKEGKYWVYVVNPQKKIIEKTGLELGYFDREKYEIVKGVKAGEVVVDRNQVVLKDQTRVTVSNPPEGWEEKWGDTEEVETKTGEAAQSDSGRTVEPQPGQSP